MADTTNTSYGSGLTLVRPTISGMAGELNTAGNGSENATLASQPEVVRDSTHETLASILAVDEGLGLKPMEHATPPEDSNTEAPRGPIAGDSFSESAAEALKQEDKGNEDEATAKIPDGSLHHHHHHHYHHHNHKHSSGPSKRQNGFEVNAASEFNQQKESADGTAETGVISAHSPRERQLRKPKKPAFDKEPVLQLIGELFPQRRVLGSIIYNPTTTWDTLQTSQLTGLKPEHLEEFRVMISRYQARKAEQLASPRQINYIPSIPPLPQEYINNLLDVKITYNHVTQFLHDLNEGNVAEDRVLWGGAGGIYTDDSDILHVLTHMGAFNNSLDLRDWNPSWRPSPTPDEFRGDISATILLLPPLPAYHGFYANDINSRSWTGPDVHTGLSFAIYNVEWGSPGTSLMDKSTAKRLCTELSRSGEPRVPLKNQDWNFDHTYFLKIKDANGA